MNFSIEEIITLDDGKEYVVCGKAQLENELYYLFIDYETNTAMKYFKEDKAEPGALISIQDEKLQRELNPLFIKSNEHIIKEVLDKLESKF